MSEKITFLISQGIQVTGTPPDDASETDDAAVTDEAAGDEAAAEGTETEDTDEA
jgi:hypothetical protein